MNTVLYEEEVEKKETTPINNEKKKILHKNGNHITQPYAICSWINCAVVFLLRGRYYDYFFLSV